MPYAMLIDVTRCVGCGQCRDACQTQNEQPFSDAETFSQDQFNYVKAVQVEDGERYVRRQCMHCEEPACASVCPVGALQKTAEGPVVYSADKCMGCRYCMVACPFSVPTYQWDKRAPQVRKCSFCAGRLVKGEQPACAAACPAEATIFGDRDELLAEAHRRIQEQPDLYVPTVYGEREAGGTSMLYLSDVPFETLGLPVGIPEESLPGLTFKVLSKIPSISMMWGTALAGTWWVIHRRMTLAADGTTPPAPQTELESTTSAGRES